MSGLRVGIDLDGVCYDFAGSLRAYLDSLGGLKNYPDVTRWEFYEDWGLDLQGFLDMCHDGVDADVIFTQGDPYPNVAEAFAMLRCASHTLHIVTDRSFGSPGASAASTLRWLDRHGLDYDSITFSADKTIADVDVMVDDKPENFHALAKAGVESWLLTRPWNKHVDTNRRVLDLLHFAEVVCG